MNNYKVQLVQKVMYRDPPKYFYRADGTEDRMSLLNNRTHVRARPVRLMKHIVIVAESRHQRDRYQQLNIFAHFWPEFCIKTSE